MAGSGPGTARGNRRRARRQDLARRLHQSQAHPHQSDEHDRGGRVRLRSRHRLHGHQEPRRRAGRERLGHRVQRSDRASHAHGDRHSINIPGDGAWDIVKGPDNNLWYTAPEGNNSKVGRITPAGEFGTQFDVTDAGDQLGITVGPDGALWFAQAVGSDIGRMTLDGQFSELKAGITAAARPEYIAPGPENTMWFTEKDGNADRSDHWHRHPTRGPPPPPDTTPPDITRFRITRKVFRLGGLGTVIRWSQSEAGTDTIGFERRINGRWRKVRRKMRVQVDGGEPEAPLPRALRLKHPLKPGRYRMTLTARDAAGNGSSPDRVRFRLLAKKRRADLGTGSAGSGPGSGAGTGGLDRPDGSRSGTRAGPRAWCLCLHSTYLPGEGIANGTHQITLETLDPDQHTGEDTRAELAKRLHADVGAPDEGGLFDLRVEAGSREEALQRVVDVLAELGVDQHFTFPSTTGTDYLRPAGAACPRTSGLPRTSRPTSRVAARTTTSRRPTTHREGHPVGATAPAWAAGAPAGSARPGSPVPSGRAEAPARARAPAAEAGWARALRRLSGSR